MKIQYTAVAAALVAGASASFNCKATVQGVEYDLTSLKGIHAVSHFTETPPSKTNTTWVINPCGKLDPKQFPEEERCPDGTQVCGIQRVAVKDESVVTELIPVSGDLDGSVAGTRVSRLEGEAGGLKVEMLDGRWGDADNLSASVEFICAKEESDLKFIDWDGTVLKLELRSPHACPRNEDSPPDKKPEDGDKEPDNGEPDNTDSSSHWGFFTWLFIIGVLGFGLYVVFTAWVNYNRYGLSGVDMLPHSDTVRDLPYLVRDFVRKVMGTFAGGPSRGGYSAV